MTRIIMLLCAALLASCAVGPDYRRPTVEVPSSWRVDYAQGEGLANTAWWESFHDPVLTDLIRSAIRENKDLKIAAARVEQFLGVLDATRSEFFPQVGYGAAATRQQNARSPLAPVDQPAFTTYQAVLNVNWELDIWGRIRRSSEAARAQVLSSDEGRRAVVLSLVSGVASSYITLRGIDRQLEIARATEKSYGESLRIFRLRHQYGTVSRVEVSQIESQYEVAAQAIPQLEALAAQQEHLISSLLGRNPGPVPRGKTIDELTVPLLPQELPLALLERRPDIRQAEQDLVAANARIGAAKALYFPTVSLSGLLGTQSSELSRLFEGGSGLWSMGGTLAGPLITFGAISGQVKQAEAVSRQLLVRYEQTIQNAFREVEDSLVATLKGREQLLSQGRQLESLADYARLSRLRYEAGSVNYLQVLDAERSLFAAQLSRVQTQAALFGAYINVYKAMGGGWIDLADHVAAEP